jgi:DNA-binding transcriptional ArsR family regulator
MPLEWAEASDPLSHLIRFRTSAVYELLSSLQTLLRPNRRKEWVAAARSVLPPDWLQELSTLYEPFFKGAIFTELAVDYPDQDDVPGFIAYVRDMDPYLFLFYILGRYLTPDEIRATGLDAAAIVKGLDTCLEEYCWYTQLPLERMLEDVPAFQRRLTDLWRRYWGDYFHTQVQDLYPRWEKAINQKMEILSCEGGRGLLEYVTGKRELPPPLPPDQPITEVLFIPVYFISTPTCVNYGYGSMTVLFDSERSESRAAEMEYNKGQLLAMLKALGDSSRLDILRLVLLTDGGMHGKQIAARLNLSPSAVSRHLAQLKDAGLISEQSGDNRTITYQLQMGVLSTLVDRLIEYIGT